MNAGSTSDGAVPVPDVEIELVRAPSRFQTGMRVEVANSFTGDWVSGFEIASIDALGLHVRRVSDGALLPVGFGYSLVRPAVD